MPTIEFDKKYFKSAAGESVLDCLLRNDIAVPYGCKNGACQSCTMHAEAGVPSVQAQIGLKEAQRKAGYFLSCRCFPTEDMRIALKPAVPKALAKVLGLAKLKDKVMRLRLEKVFDYEPGQYLNIWYRPDVIRSYSIASHPLEDDFIELHIKHIDSGQFSSWAWKHLQVGDSLEIQGPMGSCYYDGCHLEQPVLLAGIGTGLAPLLGIARKALSTGHIGPVRLVVGSRDPAGFYLQDELSEFAERHTNLKIDLLVEDSADIYSFIKSEIPSVKGYRIFLCGAESFVKKIKKQCFLAGADLRDISADAFLPCA